MAAVTAQTRPENGEGSTPAVSVLVVDIHSLLADSVMRALRLEGYDAHAADPSTSAAVLESARLVEPAVALVGLDFGSGEFSGLDLIGPLTEMHIAVVVLTGWQDRLLTAVSLERGAAGVVYKSEPFAAVVRAVDVCATGQALHNPFEQDELLREFRERRRAHADLMAPFDHLSSKEREVLSGLIDGRSANAIAAMSFVSISTVRSQIRSVLQKLNVNSQLEAVAVATRCGWSPETTLPLVSYSSTLVL